MWCDVARSSQDKKSSLRPVSRALLLPAHASCLPPTRLRLHLFRRMRMRSVRRAFAEALLRQVPSQPRYSRQAAARA